jgi:NAD(P)H-hydrate epimerase
VKVVTGAEMRAIERQVEASGTPIAELAARAGRALADVMLARWPQHEYLLLVGPGNNGGDGETAARALASAGASVTLYSFRRPAGAVPFDWIEDETDTDHARLRSILRRGPLTADCLLGTGSARPPEGSLAQIIETVNKADVPVVAADIPSGVNPDTGAVDTVAVRAHRTVAFGFAKVGDVVYPGAQYTGELEVASLGIPDELASEIRLQLTDRGDAAHMLPRRPLDSNKGTYGRVLVVGGSHNFPSAPGLSSIAALRSGAGLAEAAVLPLSQQIIAAHALEPIYSLLPGEDGFISPDAVSAIRAALQRADAAVVGPGLGSSSQLPQLMRDTLRVLGEGEGVPAVIDADGLNGLARLGEWWTDAPRLILTPHPGEMARLSGKSIAEIQRDRVGTARSYSALWGAVVVLKGAGTVIAFPEGDAWINPTGGPNLATGGTGDVLSGVIAGLLAQGADQREAAISGVYLHGLAGDRLAEGQGDAGTLASDLLTEIPRARQALQRGGEG